MYEEIVDIHSNTDATDEASHNERGKAMSACLNGSTHEENTTGDEETVLARILVCDPSLVCRA